MLGVCSLGRRTKMYTEGIGELVVIWEGSWRFYLVLRVHAIQVGGV